MKKFIFLLVVALGVGGVLGIYVQHKGYVGKTLRLLESGFGAAPTESQQPAVVEQDVSSIFIPLSMRGITLPASDRSGAGGGLTAYQEDEVLLLRFDGTFWRVNSSGDAVQINLEPPENGFQDYLAFAESEAGAPYRHAPYWFRYNDVELISRSGQEFLLASFSHYDASNRCHANRISILQVPDGPLEGVAEDWETLYTSDPCLPLKTEFRAIEGHTAGGRIAYDGTEYLYIANGDFHFDGAYGPEDMIIAQDPDGHYGGVVRISLADGSAEVLSRGNRNTQGLTIDQSGNIWIAEHGARGGDEINLLKEGANYGWPYVSYGTSYSLLPLPTVAPELIGLHDGYEQPVYAFLPSIAVSSLTTVRQFDETWNGDLLVGSLRGTLLVRLRVVDNRVVFAERIQIGKRIRYVEETSNGQIAMWTDENMVLFLKKTDGGFGAEYLQYRLDTFEGPENVRNEVQAVFARCQECHALSRTDHQNAPGLGGLIGRPVGSTSFGGYSQALLDENRPWDEALLSAYLSDPEGVFPGTNMPAMEMSTAARAEIVNILTGFSKDPQIPGGATR